MTDTLIQTLKTMQPFPHACDNLQVRETHISWVILTGTFAYKIKKPVDFGFLDYTSLAARKHFCELELTLNQRLAPALYLEVLPISGSPEAPRLGDASAPFEYALKMRQFDDGLLLSHLQQRGELKEQHLQQLAQTLADFHQQADRQPPDDLGTPEATWAPVAQNFTQIDELLDADFPRQQLQLLDSWSQDTYERLYPLLQQRRSDGFVREIHGDLHLGNAVLWQDQVTAFDCIEFNASFRWCDVINDLAFLLMDLEARKLHQLAHVTLNHYLEQTGDYAGLALLNFYKVYRALVRAKVNLFRLNQPGLDQEDRASILRQFQSYMDLAESYTDFSLPYLLITFGLSGSGKSTLTHHVVRELGGIRIRSDVERKRLFGLRPLEKSQSGLTDGIYTPAATEQTYQRLTQLADLALRAGYPVTLDATNLKRQQRDQLRQVAEELGLPSLILGMSADESTLRRRLQKRQQDAAEAGEDVLDLQLASLEPLAEDERYCSITIDTDAAAASQTLVKLIRDYLKLGH